jgi:hypothetical protein
MRRSSSSTCALTHHVLIGSEAPLELAEACAMAIALLPGTDDAAPIGAELTPEQVGVVPMSAVTYRVQSTTVA